MKATITRIKKGEVVNPFSVAGEDFELFEYGGITAEVFKTEKGYVVPLVESKQQRSGHFPDFLALLKSEYPNICFTNVVNTGIIKHIQNAGIEII